MGFQNLFFSFLLSSRRKSAAAIAINVPVSSRKCDVFPFCNASADTEAADGFFGDYRLCLKLAIKPMTASPQWLLAYWINVSKPPAKIKVSKGPSRPSVITHRLRRRAGSRMHNPCLSWLRTVFSPRQSDMEAPDLAAFRPVIP